MLYMDDILIFSAAFDRKLNMFSRNSKKKDLYITFISRDGLWGNIRESK